MSTVNEIKAAIESLSPEERAELEHLLRLLDLKRPDSLTI